MELLVYTVLVFGPNCPMAVGADDDASERWFREQIAPLVSARCLGCHNSEKLKGGLDLTSRAAALEGGELGPVIEPGKPDESLLYEMVSQGKMPPKQPLAAGDVEKLRRWIELGAPWSGDKLEPPTAELERAGLDWWSLQPVRLPQVPTGSQALEVRPHTPSPSDAGAMDGWEWTRNPIDRFVLAQLAAAGLKPAQPADKQTLIRRATFDLLGLPPSPEEIADFLNDESPGAYEKLIERLLDSPHYGERWARHWLDVVRFGESHGFERDLLRPNAWRYRDYVVRALNEDKPYDEFIREQLAGDVIAPDNAESVAATGFLVAGPWDEVGNNLQASAAMKAKTRLDELDDMVGTTAATFLGLTVACARCHDHKFDPIPQRDYYRMQAVFAGVKHGDRVIVTATQQAEHRAKVAPLEGALQEAETKLAAFDRPLRERAIEAKRGAARASQEGSAELRPSVSHLANDEPLHGIEARFIYITIYETNDGTEPCIDELEIYAEGDPEKNIALSSAGAKAHASSLLPGFAIHQVEHLNDGQVGNDHSWISNQRGQGTVTIELAEPARLARLVWSRDRLDKYRDRVPTNYTIAVSLDGVSRQIVSFSRDRFPLQAAGPVKVSETELVESLTAEERSARAELVAERDRRKAVLAAIPPLDQAYAANSVEPPPTYLLRRGEPEAKLDQVEPGGLACVQTLRSDWFSSLDPGPMSEGDRRVKLADWVAHPDNPLTARVLVNRIWHYHFGRGIVDTPSDFGFNGGRPSHPELLDWLASQFVAAGWRMKPLHRLIMLSSTYRQSAVSSSDPDVDADNRLLWRFPRRRLEAEELRDAILATSGKLDRRMGGPSFHLFVYRINNVPVFDPLPAQEEGSETWRRSLYRQTARSAGNPFMDAFDCPDPSVAAPRRAATTTALQALSLLNNPFVLQHSQFFAERVVQEAGPDEAAQISRAFQLAFGREPTEEERSEASELVREHGLARLCRVLLNANEFIYVN